MFKSTSTSLILIGILAVIVGIFAIAWPGVTILALVILFAVYAFMDAGLQTMRAFSGRDRRARSSATCCSGWSTWRPACSPSPGPRLPRSSWSIVVAAWALVGGVAEFFAGFQSRRDARAPARCSSCPGWCRSRSACCCSPAPASACSRWPCCSACTR